IRDFHVTGVQTCALPILIDRSEPLYAIVRDLQKRGIRPRQAQHFSRGTLRGVLTGRAILGQVSHHGEPIRGEDGMPLSVWEPIVPLDQDRKSTRLNSSHVKISYAVFCLKKKRRQIDSKA